MLSQLNAARAVNAFDRQFAKITGVDLLIIDDFGLTQEQFERRWRSTVMDRYGWLYLLSRAALFWLLITTVVLIVGLRRMRSDRRRLEDVDGARIRV